MKNSSALVIVDLQNDFCPGGALPIPEGDGIVPVVKRYLDLFMAAGVPVFFTRDWHPARTVHFKEFGGLWPPHCIQETEGARFHPGLKIPADAVIITKGESPEGDSYSGFDGHDAVGLDFEDSLKGRGITHIYIGGLATDYCVKATALDGLGRGFKVTVLLDAIRGVDANPGDSETALEDMMAKGADTSTVDEIEFA
ncbi:MAG: nicotinamidase [Deltaproteobacteria bacterium GWC2_56_8]|nr:MAG: nicotinamidase [Deltaproteobacteria bacterium GWB2_55_19]OGP34401.1 MAG: nicotinamidase [Deltaproteobacteria bacterium GWC2_56_8]HAO93839.1 nicotinamidase [Deltaproteobacteria bacterium]